MAWFSESPHELGDDPVKILEQVLSRKYWRKLSPAVLGRIFKNASEVFPGTQDLSERLRGLVYIAERFELVNGEFLKLAKTYGQSDPGGLASLYSMAYRRVGSRCVKDILSFRRQEDQMDAVFSADMSFAAAIACDPVLLYGYYGMALLYSMGPLPHHRNIALEWCDRYWKAEAKLLSTPYQELNTVQQAQRDVLNRDCVGQTMSSYPNLLKQFGLDSNEAESLGTLSENLRTIESALRKRG